MGKESVCKRFEISHCQSGPGLLLTFICFSAMVASSPERGRSTSFTSGMVSALGLYFGRKSIIICDLEASFPLGSADRL